MSSAVITTADDILWSEQSVCAAIGHCRQNVASTINRILFLSLSPSHVYFCPRRGCRLHALLIHKNKQHCQVCKDGEQGPPSPWFCYILSNIFYIFSIIFVHNVLGLGIKLFPNYASVSRDNHLFYSFCNIIDLHFPLWSKCLSKDKSNMLFLQFFALNVPVVKENVYWRLNDVLKWKQTLISKF